MPKSKRKSMLLKVKKMTPDRYMDTTPNMQSNTQQKSNGSNQTRSILKLCGPGFHTNSEVKYAHVGAVPGLVTAWKVLAHASGPKWTISY